MINHVPNAEMLFIQVVNVSLAVTIQTKLGVPVAVMPFTWVVADVQCAAIKDN